MSYNYTYRNNKGKKILVVTLAILLVVTLGAVFVSHFAPSNAGTRLDFSIGGLNETGAYEEADNTLYTKNAIEIEDDFRVKLVFNSTIKYQVFFYDELDKFISSTDVMTESSEPTIPENATHYRVEVTPIWDEDVKKDDRVIGWFDINGYEKQLLIEVVESADEEA